MPEQATIPEYARATVSEKMGHALVHLMDYQIHFLAELDGHIDEARMARAMRLLMDAEPVLGSSFEYHWLTPRWHRAEGLLREDYFTLVEVAEEKAPDIVNEFVSRPFTLYSAPQVKALVVRTPQKDTLALKFSHVPADGRGVKDAAYLLARIYRTLADEPDWRPTPSTEEMRSSKQVMRQLGFMDRLKVIRRDLRNYSKKRGHWKRFPVSGESTSRFVRETIGPERFRTLKDYARSKGATINDLMVTACYRAFKKELGQDPGKPMGIMTTTDIRRYLPENKVDAVCILSGFFYSNIGREIGDSYEDTLKLVMDDINFQKSDYLGLGDHPALVCLISGLPFFIGIKALKTAFMASMGFGQFKGAFTNLAIIEEDLFNFNGPEVLDAYIQVPVSIKLSNVLIIGTTTFKNSITMAAGFQGSAEDQARVARILETMTEELSGALL